MVGVQSESARAACAKVAPGTWGMSGAARVMRALGAEAGEVQTGAPGDGAAAGAGVDSGPQVLVAWLEQAPPALQGAASAMLRQMASAAWHVAVAGPSMLEIRCGRAAWQLRLRWGAQVPLHSIRAMASSRQTFAGGLQARRDLGTEEAA